MKRKRKKKATTNIHLLGETDDEERLVMLAKTSQNRSVSGTRGNLVDTLENNRKIGKSFGLVASSQYHVRGRLFQSSAARCGGF